MIKPKLSVIIPTFGRPLLLKRAILSVLKQTYKNFEILVVSDASGKETDKIMEEFRAEKIIYLKHQDNKGPSAARNTGIKQARGEFLAFLDDDDEWLPEKLEKQMEKFTSLNSDYGLVYCWMQYYDHDIATARFRKPELKAWILREMLSEQAIGPSSTIVIRREVLKKTGLFNEAYWRGDDSDFIRKVAKHYKVDYVPEVLVRYHRGRKDRLSLNTRKNIKSIIKELGDRLETYRSDFAVFPREKCKVLTKLAGHYLLLGHPLEWLRYSLAAFKEFPEKSFLKKILFQVNIYKENIKKF